jgi:hypothetical protein
VKGSREGGGGGEGERQREGMTFEGFEKTSHSNRGELRATKGNGERKI